MKQKIASTIFLILIFVSITSIPQVYANPVVKVWERVFGGDLDDWGWSVQQTSDGGYILLGATQFYGAGDYDLYLIKTDPNGNAVWEQTYGGTYNDRGFSVQQTNEGGYILAGVSSSYGVGNGDVYLVKTDSLGSMQWSKTFGGTNYECGESVEQTSDGGYIIVGYTRSFGAVVSDVYLIKTDSEGVLDWSKTFGGSDWDGGSSVQQTSDGGYIVAGSTSSSGAGSSDVYLIKTDSEGVLDWFKTFGGTNYDSAGSVQQTLDGGYILAGATSSSGAGSSDVYLIKTNSLGNEEWSETFGGPDYDLGYSVQQTSDGGYIIVAETSSFGAGLVDIYLIKTDFGGLLEWSETFGGPDYDYGYSILQNSDDDYIVVGERAGASWEYDDVYMMKVTENAFDIEPPITSNVVASPSPASVEEEITITAAVDDTGTGGSTIASAEYSLDDGVTWTPMIAFDGLFDQMCEDVTVSIPPNTITSGVYTVLVRGTDSAGYTSLEVEASIPLVVYNPEGGFVTGGGWINSPEGAYTADLTLTGKASFGFVSKYNKGASTPTGNTRFIFRVADLTFHSDNYDWLVIAGAKAMYKGTGTINGEEKCMFMLSAVDGDLTNNGGADAFRIKIWDEVGEVIYDNQLDADDYAEATTELQGGSIVIHKEK